ncbi:ArsR family transcriptional regulator [Lactobacillus sp. CC-MHH1034]|uniref:ArsR/SmtB family transcription factor n=1 Tax=Agrilactobacillus fermenti TaxID=2586909 RepID=UPI001E3FCAAA|nr:ArsR family transcriptional regulator [Agrilactobacillus fermenti]MCD2257293.1 ArsR family transcriptional regulator [Agrilactobacillus fermenti]
MELEISKDSLVVYKALSSEVRLQIIQLLTHQKMSIQELAQHLNLSNAIVLMHLNKLEAAGIIGFERSGHKKLSYLKVDNINIHFPQTIYPAFAMYTVEISVGQFTDYSVTPSCGLAGQNDYIGKVDNPQYFMSPDRVKAGMIWWIDGYVEYQFPNYLETDDKLEMLDLSMELGSEFPFSNNVWPSDITISINQTEIGTWTSPGDFSDIRGKYTLDWVPDNVNQYGLLKILRVTNHGSYLDGQPFTDVSIDTIDWHEPTFTVRFEVKKDARHRGGCTIFGHNFGNYNQDIQMKLFHS